MKINNTAIVRVFEIC